MAATTIANIINPEVLSEQISALFPEKMVLANTGAVLVDPAGLSGIQSGGDRVKIPRWKRVADFGNPTEGSAFTRNNITTDAEYAFVVRKGASYGVVDTAALVSQADPADEIRMQLAEKTARAIDASLVKTLSGAIPSANTHDPGVQTSGTGLTIQYNHVIDAAVKLGDNMDELQVIIMHSKPYSDALKANLITFVNGEPFMLGKRVFVSDGCPVSADTTKVYTNFLLGPQALYLAYQRNLLVEFDRDIEALIDIIAASVHYVPHLLGMSFTGTPAAATGPTDTELSTTGNWTLKAQEAKSVRAVILKTN